VLLLLVGTLSHFGNFACDLHLGEGVLGVSPMRLQCHMPFFSEQFTDPGEWCINPIGWTGKQKDGF
jgi:hypothetical protein